MDLHESTKTLAHITGAVLVDVYPSPWSKEDMQCLVSYHKSQLSICHIPRQFIKGVDNLTGVHHQMVIGGRSHHHMMPTNAFPPGCPG